MALTGLEKTAIVIIAILIYYVIMMVISIILAKTNHPTAARCVKTLSILNYPFKKLNEYSIHIDNDDKYRTIAKTYIVKQTLGAIESSDLGKKLIEEHAQSISQPTSSPQVETIHETVVESLPPQPTQAETTPEPEVF